MGITNTQALLNLGLNMIVAGEDIFKGGKFQVQNLGELIALVPAIESAPAEIPQVGAELKGITEGEAASLIATVVAKFNVADANAVKIINAALVLAFDGIALAKLIENKAA